MWWLRFYVLINIILYSVYIVFINSSCSLTQPTSMCCCRAVLILTALTDVLRAVAAPAAVRGQRVRNTMINIAGEWRSPPPPPPAIVRGGFSLRPDLALTGRHQARRAAQFNDSLIFPLISRLDKLGLSGSFIRNVAYISVNESIIGSQN